MSEKWIRASEISSYVYCNQAWWLQRSAGHAPENLPDLAEGRRYHRSHGRLLARSVWWQRLAYVMLFFIVAFVTFRLLMSLGL
jgi:hypothetical protein